VGWVSALRGDRALEEGWPERQAEADGGRSYEFRRGWVARVSVEADLLVRFRRFAPRVFAGGLSAFYARQKKGVTAIEETKIDKKDTTA
jgi:hypothetical protein